MAMIEKKEKKYLSYRADSKMNVDVFSGIRKKIPEKALKKEPALLKKPVTLIRSRPSWL